MKFKELEIGAKFDFINPDRVWNSFYERCEKISPRKYKYESRGKIFTLEVGTVNVEIFHVEE